MTSMTFSNALVALISIMCLSSTASADDFVVSSLADSGPGSLRAAVESANETSSPDVIRFGKKLRGIIKLTSGQIAITEPLTIAGSGASRLTISGSNSSRIFRITSAVVSISNLTIADGCSRTQESVPIIVTRGGGILNDGGTLNLSGVTMRDNMAINEVDSQVVGGGAIVNSAFATLDAVNCQFINNIAQGGTRYSFGGAIASVTESVAVVENCLFAANASISGATTYGGAIGNFGGSDLTVLGCSFTGNTARGINLGENAFGGAIATRPGTVDNSGSLTTIDSSLLTANLAMASDGGGSESGADAGGGALFTFGSTLIANSTLLNENEARGGSGSSGGGDALGGAVQIAGSGLSPAEFVQINQCQFFGNLAAGGSSGGQGLGGAIHSDIFGQVFFQRSRISRNLAIGGQDGDGIGGGIFTLGLATADRATIRKIVGNRASTSDDDIAGIITVD